VSSLRDRNCGDLRASDSGKTVTVAGWVHSRRDHGGVYFFDLRDRSGLLQVVVHPDNAEAFLAAGKLHSEFVVSVTGKIGKRPEGTVNPKMPTGEVELTADALKVLNVSKALPFEIDEHATANEETRLKYRFLDLRRPKMLGNFALRHKVAMAARKLLDSEGFLEIETPILTKATPEGARDFLVPSRLHPGSFYALPQSPQIFKQILMVSGVERYFQLARAFRDEDLRADRQPEHTQIDVEMSFVEEKDVHAMAEKMMAAIFREAMGVELETPFPSYEYADVMAKYGSDKPDLRYGLEIEDLTDLFKASEFKVFGEAARSGGVVRALKVTTDLPRAQIDKLTDLAKELGARGLAWIKWEAAGPSSPIIKAMKPEEFKALEKALDAKTGDIAFFGADKAPVVANVLGAIRKEMIKKLALKPSKPWAFAWVKHFPLLEWEPDEKRWTFAHNPFTAPLEEELPLLDSDPGKMRSHQYDLVLNGVELASGSIRNHRGDVQRKILALMGFSPEEQVRQFGLLLNALDYGAPPHGGFGLGFDRLTAILRGEESIREVIAFPKTQKGTCPLSEAPGPVGDKQLRELHIKPSLPPKPSEKAPA
jgi:aspartyl-tRNA synthetase